jgi:hypothetical protein
MEASRCCKFSRDADVRESMYFEESKNKMKTFLALTIPD